MRSATPDELMRDPIGRYVAGRSYAIWVDSASLAGSVYWDRPDVREFPEILQLVGLPQHAHLDNGFDAVIDCSELEAMDRSAFAVLLQYLHEAAKSAPKLGKVSIVRPTGMAGTLVAGLFHDNIRAQFRSALFADRVEAFAWLGREDGLAARERVDALMAALRNEDPWLRDLRSLLAASANRSLAETARAMGLSERSLSRRLGDCNTTLRSEVQLVRLRLAEALLIDTDLKLDLVAAKVGFKSRAHFSEFFSTATGETPSDFRARRR